MKYLRYAEELRQLLHEDQQEGKALARLYWQEDKTYRQKRQLYKTKMRGRTERMLEILQEIGEPSITNIGSDGVLAMSVLATHDAARALSIVLKAFELLLKKRPEDCRYESIPAMTDWLLILQSKPQRFGTQWLFDKNKWPFLPAVEDFARVNERRAAYGLEPLRWPKSLAVPETEQPWLKRPLSEMVMRDLTQEERERLVQ